MRRISIVIAVLALAAFAAPAQASIPLQNVSAEPDNKAAGEPANFHIHFELGGSEHIKDLIQELPASIGTNVNQPTCDVAVWQNDACPTATQIGTSDVNLTAGMLLPQDVGGRIYYLTNLPGELPTLGIILDAPSPFKKAFQQATLEFDTERGILVSTIRDFPQQAELQLGGGVPLRINSLDVILKDTFFRNSLECKVATTRLRVNSYEDPGTTTVGQASYTPTGCKPVVRRARCGGLRVTILGTPRANTLRGTRRRDVISGLGGRDVIRGLAGNDVICGGQGPDRIFGGAGADLLIGNSGNDRLFGGAGRDRVRGGTGRDLERP